MPELESKSEIDDQEYITDESPRLYDLADGLELAAFANPSDPLRPIRYVARHERGGGEHGDPVPLVTVTPPGGGFDTPTERERVGRTIATLNPGDADREAVETAVDEAIQDLGEDVATGRVLPTDEKVRKIIRTTDRVEFDPESAEWQVWFSDRAKDTAKFGVERATIPAGDFAAAAASSTVRGAVPDELWVTPFGSSSYRWPQVRDAWIRMAMGGNGGEDEAPD